MLRIRQTINCSMIIFASNNDVLQVAETTLYLYLVRRSTIGYWESVHLVNLRHSHGGTGEGFFHSALSWLLSLRAPTLKLSVPRGDLQIGHHC
jgi:hypothetical protein